GGRKWMQALGADFERDVPAIDTVFDAATRRRLVGDREWVGQAEAIRRARTPGGTDILQRATRMDFSNYLAEDILVKVDRASMLTSLEVRAPFLDHRIIEFAFANVPSSLKATVDGQKILLKKLCERVLPPEFDHQRKWGFSIPLSHWLESGPWSAFFREVLLDGETFFAKAEVEKLLDGQRKGRNNSERLFALVL